MEKALKKAGDHISLVVSVITLISVLGLVFQYFGSRDQTDAVQQERIAFMNVQFADLKSIVAEQGKDIKAIHTMVARLEGRR
jgi:hypothetical protein